MLLWLWNRLTAVALILPLAWELSYTVGVALKNKQTKKKVYLLFSQVLSCSLLNILMLKLSLFYYTDALCIIILVFSLDS